MKIAAYTNSMDGSGARRAFFEFVKGLSASHTIDLYHFSGTPMERFPITDYVKSVFEYDLAQYRESSAKPYLLALIIGFFTKFSYLRKLKQISLKMSEDISKRGYDLAYIDVCNFIRVPYLLRFLEIPTVFYHHRPHRDAFEPLKYISSGFSTDGLSFVMRMYKKLSAFVFRAGNLMVGLTGNENCRHASLVLTNSRYMQGFIYSSCGVIAKLHYLGVDQDYFRPLGTERKDYVLTVGGIEEAKGLEDIVRSLSLIPEEKRPPFLVIAGRRRVKFHQQLVALAKEKNVRMTIIENVFGEELIRYYNEALMVVFVPVMEPFGFVPLESMACGTPVIGIREGGILETVIDGENGILADRDDQELADAIIRLTESPEMRERFSLNGIKYVRENWTWDKSLKQFEKHIRKIAKGSE